MPARSEQQLEAYREQILRLRRADAHSSMAGAAEAQSYAAFSVGFLMGAGIPGAAATLAHLYRRAYPGEYLPALVEDEA